MSATQKITYGISLEEVQGIYTLMAIDETTLVVLLPPMDEGSPGSAIEFGNYIEARLFINSLLSPQVIL